MPLPNRSTIANFGGYGKLNNANLPPSNPTTDWDNTLLGACTSDVAALGQIAPRFWCRITLAATTGALVLNSWKAQWINVTSTTPVLARTTTGIYTITLPVNCSDEYDSSLGLTGNITINLSAASSSLEGSTFGFSNASASGNVITISTANTSGSAADLTGSVLFVVGY
jgi:hypothetical protein